MNEWMNGSTTTRRFIYFRTRLLFILHSCYVILPPIAHRTTIFIRFRKQHTKHKSQRRFCDRLLNHMQISLQPARFLCVYLDAFPLWRLNVILAGNEKRCIFNTTFCLTWQIMCSASRSEKPKQNQEKWTRTNRLIYFACRDVLSQCRWNVFIYHI